MTLSIKGFSEQRGVDNTSFGYVHIYDDETGIELVHTFELVGPAEEEVLMSVYNAGNTTYHSTVEKE